MTQLPSKQDILRFIANNPGEAAKRDIARAFGLKGAGKVELKRLLAEMAEEGSLEQIGRAHV